MKVMNLDTKDTKLDPKALYRSRFRVSSKSPNRMHRDYGGSSMITYQSDQSYRTLQMVSQSARGEHSVSSRDSRLEAKDPTHQVRVWSISAEI